MKVFVVSRIQDCDNQWVEAVFYRKEDVDVWIENQQKDYAEYRVGSGAWYGGDTGCYDIEELEVRESPSYTTQDIEGLRVNYEGVLKPRGWIPPEGSNYRLVTEKP